MAMTIETKTISPHGELDCKQTAKAELKALRVMIQDGLRLSRAARLTRELKAVLRYWARKTSEKLQSRSGKGRSDAYIAH
jgi:hypothetical protein